MAFHFVKMHGCGNDFVIMDGRATLVELAPRQVAALADRHRGIGFDQLISLEPAEDADVLMRIRNPDGSEAGACGNATRCVADILMRETGRRRVTVRTAAGILPSERRSDGLIQVNMGKPKLDWADIPLARDADTLSLDLPGSPAAASMGNPHVTFLVDDVDRIPVGQLGPRFETDALFPDRANIGFAQVLARDAIRLKVWERGAGLTLACGSGACATLVNAHRRGLADRQAKVILDGGELRVEWLPDGDVLMAGPVATVFKGEASLT